MKKENNRRKRKDKEEARMVELRLDSNDNAFLPDNDTVYVDEGQFIPSLNLLASSDRGLYSYFIGEKPPY